MKKRKVIAYTGKQGYIMYLVALAKAMNRDDNFLKEYEEQLQRDIPEGIYKIPD